jgi:hypothetical protein
LKIVGVQASAWGLEDSEALLEFTALACLEFSLKLWHLESGKNNFK